MDDRSFKGLDAVLFDAGYTLVFPDYEFIGKLLSEYGTEIPMEKLKQLDAEAKALTQTKVTVFPWKLYFRTWFGKAGVDEKQLPELFAKLWARHRQHNLWGTVGEGVEETLDNLKRRGYRLGVISNSDGQMAELLRQAGVIGFFEVVVDSGVIGIRKPDSRIFEFALKQLDIEPSRALFVGDSEEIDYRGALNAGLHAVLLDPFDSSTLVRGQKLSQLTDILTLLE